MLLTFGRLLKTSFCRRFVTGHNFSVCMRTRFELVVGEDIESGGQFSRAAAAKLARRVRGCYETPRMTDVVEGNDRDWASNQPQSGEMMLDGGVSPRRGGIRCEPRERRHEFRNSLVSPRSSRREIRAAERRHNASALSFHQPGRSLPSPQVPPHVVGMMRVFVGSFA